MVKKWFLRTKKLFQHFFIFPPDLYIKGEVFVKTKFKRHFRIYLVNNHPAYIVDEEGNQYVFHRMTESKSSGGRNNWKMKVNPVENCFFTCYMVRKEQKDEKSRFSKQKLRTKKGVDVSYHWIKRANKK